MDGLVLTGIGQLMSAGLKAEGAAAPVVVDAAVVCSAAGTVSWVGPEAHLPEQVGGWRQDLGGRAVVPGFVDSHTHLVFAGHRAAEWEARMAGVPYRAGGIATTVAATRAASRADLTRTTRWLADEARASGTTTLEVKSGYGLTVDHERRLLDVARTVTDETTYLGAHVVPPDYAGRPDDYVDLVCGAMLDACAPAARWIDVFCDRGAFDVDQASAVLAAGAAAGLAPRLHAAQLGPGPAVRMGVEAGAASVDHCTHLTDADIEALAGSTTVATLLPAAEFCTGNRYPHARTLLDAGVTVALATDCNPGSSFTTSMPLVVALAVREMGLTVPEAVWAATAGGAAALRRTDIGRLVPGCRADLVVLEAPDVAWLAYRPGVPGVRAVVAGGALVAGTWPDSAAPWRRTA